MTSIPRQFTFGFTKISEEATDYVETQTTDTAASVVQTSICKQHYNSSSVVSLSSTLSLSDILIIVISLGVLVIIIAKLYKFVRKWAFSDNDVSRNNMFNPFCG